MTDDVHLEEPGPADDAVARALRAAIVSVEAAVARVHELSAEILELVGAPDGGDAVDHHNALTRVAGILDGTGRLRAADWESVRGLGDVLADRAERLHAHAGRLLDGLAVDAPAQDRVACLQQAVATDRLGETLQLLVLVEDSLNLWQRLRLEQVRTTEPDRLEHERAAIGTSLAGRVERDVALLLRARARLASYAGLTPFELVRWLSSARVKRDIARFRTDLDDVAAAFGSAAQRALEAEDPAVAENLVELGKPVRAAGGALGESARTLGDSARTLGDSARTLGDSARTLGGRAVGAGTTGVGKLGRGLHRVAEPRRRPDGDVPLTTAPDA
ncbi:hypothetical protein QM787_04725 [Rhodococcus ruber]|uniref:Uncharacterized protein n=1 Tax=Rhodococcus ruber TaxID=1830 RepID=A0A098BW23_9NOCA|nr:hypothetical protein [Rhodococcus ruber]AXY51333.1 hypothetical protein YT1_1899 [Rhodococcus ruber]MBP2210750.1 hypothetical protein [Rhodococcus ruber]MCD2127805.1 hypothetical protein [Rhodococcus ruber]MCZ4504464.1 hypothetical protein [Rhodococcus ruber]MCZ4529300.1 hypothetical protein [Rhodococcus ruber]